MKQYPLRTFFKKPDRAFFRLSADGRFLSFLQPWSENGGPARQNIFIQALTSDGQLTGQPRQLTSATDRDMVYYFWKGSETILFIKDFGGDENYHVAAVNIHSGAVRDLTPFAGVRAGITSDLYKDPDHILVSHNQRNPELFDVYKVNIFTGASTLAAENPGTFESFQTDHSGTIRLATGMEGLQNCLYYRESETQPFRKILGTNFKDDLSPICFTFDNQRLFANSNLGRDKKALVEWDPAAGREIRVLAEHPEYDMLGLEYSRERLVLTQYLVNTHRLEKIVVDDKWKQLFVQLEALFPGQEVMIQDSTKDEDLFVVAVNSDRTEGSRYLYRLSQRQLTKLGDINPELPAADMAAMKPITYTSRDGLTIHGYLTLPVGKPAAHLPFIIHPHGGPWVRDFWGFNNEIQFLANRGYGVLQMDYRGSTGYGKKFWEASFRQWGKTMQDDITDGVQWLIDQGLADPKRIAIYGASYGGYATLRGITKTPKLYAAAVDYVGVSNLLTFMKTIPPYWELWRTQMYEMVGNPETSEAELRAESPVFQADKIVTPLFIAQGANDPRVNKDESDQMVAALRQRGVPVEYLVKDNEGHGFHNQENQFEFYEAMEKFLARHLGQDK